MWSIPFLLERRGTVVLLIAGLVIGFLVLIATAPGPREKPAHIPVASTAPQAPTTQTGVAQGRSVKAALFETALAACSGFEGCIIRVFETTFGSECRRMIGREMVTFYRFHEDEPTFSQAIIPNEGDFSYIVMRGNSLFVQDASGTLVRRGWTCVASRVLAPSEDHMLAVWY